MTYDEYGDANLWPSKLHDVLSVGFLDQCERRDPFHSETRHNGPHARLSRLATILGFGMCPVWDVQYASIFPFVRFRWC